MSQRAPAVILCHFLQYDTGDHWYLSRTSALQMKYPSARFQHAEPSGSAATASDLSDWLLSTTHYGCIMRTKKRIVTQALKVRFIVDQNWCHVCISRSLFFLSPIETFFFFFFEKCSRSALLIDCLACVRSAVIDGTSPRASTDWHLKGGTKANA